MSTVFSFTKRTLSAVKKADPDLFDQIVAPFGNPASYVYLHEVGLRTLFEKSGVLDNPGRSPLVRSLAYEELDTEDFKEWLYDGGSPMLSTELKRKGVEAVQILGYRASVFSSYPSTYPPYQFPEMPMEQWLLGTTPAMIASSILRAVGAGQLSAPKIERVGIPPGLFLAFKDPQVAGLLTEYLANQPKIRDKGSFLQHASHFGGVAYLLSKHGTDDQLKAMAQSPAGAILVDNATEVYCQLMFCECCQDEPNFEVLVNRIAGVFDQDALAPEFDDGIARLFKSDNTTGHDALTAFCLKRLPMLAESGRLHQAIGWLHRVADSIEATPVLNDQARREFVEAFRWQPQPEKHMMQNLSSGKHLRLALSLLGPDAFLAEYLKEIKHAFSASWSNVSTDMGLGGIIGTERLPDPGVLKEFGLVKKTLETVELFWEDHWADNAEVLSKLRNPNLGQRMLKDHLVSVAKWAGAALTEEPDKEMANRWFDCLGHAFLQHVLVDAMPMDIGIRQRMEPRMRGQQFIRDLGV